MIASAADAQRDITGESNDRDFTCQICLSDKQVHNDQNTPNNESIINIKNIATPSGKINQSQPLPEFQYQTSKKSRKPEELYQMLNDSVHRVFAASRPDDFINYEDISQGSAVAINENLMLTNCHIFENKPYIIFEDSHGIHSGSLHKSDFDRDVCMVSSDIHVLSPVKYTRSYDDIAIGEKIYAIGSPEGFEDTLSDGIVSGKRVNDDMNIIQMTAPITFGSSGGGLFDTYGNLIGITTSGMNSGSLNFAIPIVEYF